MRKVILSAAITLDGYIARPDGAVDFLFMPKDYSMESFMASVDTAILGRKTYDLVDELRLGVIPILLGEGIPLFPSGFPQRDFTLEENKTYSRGLISREYRRRGKAARRS